MSIDINGIAHVQLTVSNKTSLLFWRDLLKFFNMSTLIDGEDVHYRIGGKTGVLVRLAPPEKRERRFDQDTSGLHHICFRARSVEDVNKVSRFVEEHQHATLVHAGEEGDKFAPGYYSVLFEDPDGIRVEVNFVPGKGHFGRGGRLGESGSGPASSYGDRGLTDD